MKIYLIAFGAGMLAGILYGLLGVRSPAPPIVALAGLLGILIGEQAAPLAKRLLNGEPTSVAMVRDTCSENVLGALPGGKKEDAG